MTPPHDPGVIDSIGNGIWIALLVGANVWTRFRGSKKLAAKIDVALDAKVEQIEGALGSLRGSLDKAIESIGQLRMQLGQTEKADERLQVEMHSLSGRVDAANEKYTEILKALNVRNAASAQKEAVTGSVTFKEEKKPK